MHTGSELVLEVLLLVGGLHVNGVVVPVDGVGVVSQYIGVVVLKELLELLVDDVELCTHVKSVVVPVDGVGVVSQ